MRKFNGVARWWKGGGGRRGGPAWLAAAALLLAACHDGTAAGPEPASGVSPAAQTKAPAGGEADDADGGRGKPGTPAPPAVSRNPAAEGVTLTPEQIDQLGLATQPALRVEHRDEAAGYGVVVGHEVIAQGAAELASAQATERQSRAALARARKLAGTPGAVSADVEEAAAQKAAVDAAALTLTLEKMTGTLGLYPPWKSEGSSKTLRDLASGRLKLVRATFPLGTLEGGRPSSLRAARLGTTVPGNGWTLHTLWDAPADAAIPGRSYFALLAAGDAGEGERLRVWAPVGSPETGVLIPAAAALLHEGSYWCYVERKPGTFVRLSIDISKPMEGGYFLSRGVAAGDKIVTAAAGLLLAKEAGAGAESE